MRNIIDELQTKPYDFLRQNADLKNCIYLTLSGSHGYGTNNENSDIDLRGVLVEPPQYIYGLQNFEQFEDRITDTVIFGLKKYIALCVAANPNALELLGTEENCIVLQTEAGKLLRESANTFLSQRVITSFGHYATAQLRRFCNALCHDQYSEQEQEKHLEQTLCAQIDHFNRTYTSFDKHALKIYQDKDNVLCFDIALKSYPLRDFVGIYGEISNIVKTYNKLNHRNRKKDDAHLFKHAMHLLRLLIMGSDILNGNEIITKREKEHSAEEYIQKFQAAAETTNLPATPDIDKVETLMMQIYEIVLAS